MLKKSDHLSVRNNRSHLDELRDLLKAQKLDGFFIPHGDEYMNEYLPPSAERLAWLTGFTGSAGQAIILKTKAVLFVDGRYTLQAAQQIDASHYDIVLYPDTLPIDWLVKNVSQNDRIGYDPKLHTVKSTDALKKALKAKNVSLVPVHENLIDHLWIDRPSAPQGQISIHPLKYAGVSTEKKIEHLQQDLKRSGHDAVVVTRPESIAWLFNIRGTDIPHTPVALSYAIVHADKKPDWFIDPLKINEKIADKLKKNLNLHEPHSLAAHLKELGAVHAKVCLDPEASSVWFSQILKNAKAEIIKKTDPCLHPKAIKNKAEIDGSRAAHERDGIAVCQFLAWLDRTVARQDLDEMQAASQLELFRRNTGLLKDLSFDTISGSGPNGAIIHYRVTEKTNRKLKQNSLFLIDSGAQYQDGTTDITRTVAIGEPSKEMRRNFTLVLKGHIELATARFPKGTKGSALDTLARLALWKAGLEYEHGTGHGVGSYLSVHESPPNIGKRSDTVLEAGMIVSNEPGFYKTGKYGIRIENLILVTGPEDIKGGERPMLGFETLTLAPIDFRLIEIDILTNEELDWLNTYHARVRKVISPSLDKADRDWLKQATAPLTRK